MFVVLSLAARRGAHSFRLLGLAGALGLGAGEARPATFGWDAGYPGPQPGPARMVCQGESLIVSNAALSLSWAITPQGFRAQSIRNGQTGQTRALTGEVFRIILASGQAYAASSLVPEASLRVVDLVPDPRASRLAKRIPGRQAELALRSADGRLRVVWRATIHDGGNYVRQEIDVTAAAEDCVIDAIAWFEEAVPGARTVGEVDGSPVVASDFFFGLEDPHALNLVEAAGSAERGARVACRLRRGAPLRKDTTLTASFVVGVAPLGQLRRAFLYYLERERAHPYRPFLHYNSWYDIAWDPFALNETNCLEAIRLFGERCIQSRGVVLDAMVFDDGWDDPKTLWQFHGGFPRGFAPLADACRAYHTHLGVWLSPFGGYGEPRNQRLKFGGEQGYETNATGFSLAGPNYYAAFKRACVGMIRRYGVNHFKFDGIAAGLEATGGAAYRLDTEAMRRLMLELRQEAPDLYLNLTTGSWPSPFWLRYADSVWRQGNDMGQAGKGTRQQQWLTYRDQETHRNIVRRGPLYPLNSLMTQGVAYSRRGLAGDPTFTAAGFKDDVRAFFGSGTGLQELYLQPGKLTAEDWDVLAEAARWSRARSDVLVDTHWIGGDPAQLEVYGYASWSPRLGIVMLRNPNDTPQESQLDVGAVFELPPGAPTRYTLRSPWVEDVAKPERVAEAGQAVQLRLEPWEVLILEATP